MRFETEGSKELNHFRLMIADCQLTKEVCVLGRVCMENERR